MGAKPLGCRRQFHRRAKEYRPMKMTDPTILICGSGRCGSTLLMTMLNAAGIPCVGEQPDFECLDTVQLAKVDYEVFERRITGKAVKLLDPHLLPLRAMPDAHVIWLKRNTVQQARSMMKLAAQVVGRGAVDDSRRGRRAMSQNLRTESKRIPPLLSKHVQPKTMSVMDFETIIEHPSAFARALCDYLGIPKEKAADMARCVVDRETDCLPYMLETSLVMRR
ncbi:MAG: hypothetical protein C0429_06905 [Sphingopyxis sp.]|nr:hypothetical protein [Sphingopyxis sp.]